MFRKKKIVDPNSLLQDSWHTDFGWFESKRFPAEVEQDYSAKTRRRRLELRIFKPSCFAWVLSPYQYGDFMIQAKLRIGEENGHSSAGFVFRYNNEDNFYYFLLSNRDRFRFDVVFNKYPLHLIEWTPMPSAVEEAAELRIIVRNNTFSFFVGDEWLAEVSDDTLKTGFFGLSSKYFRNLTIKLSTVRVAVPWVYPHPISRSFFRDRGLPRWRMNSFNSFTSCWVS